MSNKIYLCWNNPTEFDHVMTTPYKTMLRMTQTDRLVHFIPEDETLGFLLKDGRFCCELGHTDDFLAIIKEVPPYDPNTLDREYPPTFDTWEKVLKDNTSMQLWMMTAQENMRKMENTTEKSIETAKEIYNMLQKKALDYDAVVKVLFAIVADLGCSYKIPISDIDNYSKMPNVERTAREENGILYLDIMETPNNDNTQSSN